MNVWKYGVLMLVLRFVCVLLFEFDDDIVSARRRRDFDVGFRRTASGKFIFGGED